jgi:Phosphotransferase enzyme family
VRANDWNDPRWQGEAHDWVANRLAEFGTPVTGEIEQRRVRPWSVTHRAATAAGFRWFKANTTDCRYEAALADALSRIVPGATLPPLALDAGRGWLLTADAGRTLHETVDPDRRLTTWADMLQAYAVLQRATAPHAADLLALGVPDLRVSVLPGVLSGLLADPLMRAEVDPAVPAMVAEFGQWCGELAADGIPAAVQHDDLHDNNVFTDLRFFDWGDASIAHPFGSLLVALNVMQDTLRVPNGAPVLTRLRDAYLEPWSDLADPATLRRSVTLACRVTRLSRAMAWRRALRDAAVPVDEGFRAAPAAWLNELLAETAV